jgi:hypothetical protein
MENQGANMELQIDWTDPIECIDCDNRATHVQVSADDAGSHSDVVILAAYCDEHYEGEVLACPWLHMDAALDEAPSQVSPDAVPR